MLMQYISLASKGIASGYASVVWSGFVVFFGVFPIHSYIFLQEQQLTE